MIDMKKILIFLLIPIIFTISCEKKSEKELELLQTYLNQHNITTEPTKSGLYYIETLKGDGDYPKYGNTVTVDYEGKFLDGQVFDTSYDKDPFSFNIGYGQVINGWDEGILYMKNGGKATLIIPSSLAYGSKGNNDIPPYSTLIFDIELLAIY
jgi:FKBP-type peptidyl-prolyl cis-trans isomerase